MALKNEDYFFMHPSISGIIKINAKNQVRGLDNLFTQYPALILLKEAKTKPLHSIFPGPLKGWFKRFSVCLAHQLLTNTPSLLKIVCTEVLNLKLRNSS